MTTEIEALRANYKAVRELASSLGSEMLKAEKYRCSLPDGAERRAASKIYEAARAAYTLANDTQGRLHRELDMAQKQARAVALCEGRPELLAEWQALEAPEYQQGGCGARGFYTYMRAGTPPTSARRHTDWSVREHFYASDGLRRLAWAVEWLTRYPENDGWGVRRRALEVLKPTV